MLRPFVLLVVVLGSGGCGRSSSPPASNPGEAASPDAGSSPSAADAEPDAAHPDSAAARPESGPSGSAAEADPSACPPRDRWPEGMACVPGGTFTLGSTEGQPDEREPGEVTLDAFYIDTHEVTNEAYRACVEAGRCQRAMPYRGFTGPRQPIVAVSWDDAVAFCRTQGKRLPTEAEWERAASGPEHTTYPWGDEPGGCDKANITDRRGHGCGRDVTLDVGSLEPGHYGLYDMAGNVHEWVADWYSPCLRGCQRECGDACFGHNPRGPCGGAGRCPGRTRRSIRGGSWYWPEERARTTARRGADPRNEGNHRFGFRCARDLVTEAAAAAGTEEGTEAETEEAEAGEAGTAAAETGSEEAEAAPRAIPADVSAPLSDEARQVLDAIPSEDLSLPREHYFHSNEWRHDLLAPHLRGVGGALIGVGADQNYTVAALAGSELLLLVDFDPRIPRLHRIYGVLVSASATGAELVGRFSDDSAEATAALLRAELSDDEEVEAIVTQFMRFRPRWQAYLRRVRRMQRDGGPFGWLADPEMYAYVRALFRSGRVIARSGDLTGEHTLRAMGRAAERLGLYIGVYYPSNAEQFFPFTPSYIENIRAMPAGPRSVVVRTTRHPRLPNAGSDTWHYIVQDLTDFRERLETGSYPRSRALLHDLISAGAPAIGREGVSTITAAIPRRSHEIRQR